MKNLKFTVLIFVLLLTLPLLFSCTHSGGNSAQTEEPTVEMIAYPITEYTVIRGEKASQEVVLAAVSLRKAINNLLVDKNIPIMDDWIKGGVLTEEIANSKEMCYNIMQ